MRGARAPGTPAIRNGPAKKQLRGREFGTLRTLMLVMPPVAAGPAGPLITAVRPGAAAPGMAALASSPGLVLVLLFPPVRWGVPAAEQWGHPHRNPCWIP